ncbi:MAG TPA: AsmA-like C-terminal region-containing protein, partial [Candidatus Krumholzibacterium sp.]|nr:AsmA-like C-terminal region-containing protein [Candidatus Krumholzibacterium sp.]
GSLPMEISSGTMKLKAGAKGSAKDPSGAAIGGTLALTGIEGTDRATGLPFRAGGTIAFDDKAVKSEGFSVSSGASSLNTSFAVALGEDRKPIRVDLEAKVRALAGDLAGLAGNDSLEASGEIDGSIGAGGSPAAFKALFAAAGGVIDPAAMRKAWDDVALKGKLSVKKGRFGMKGQPVGISSLDLECGLAGGGLETIKAGFVMGGRPWSVEGSARGIFPCAAELLALTKEGSGKGPGGKALGAGALLDKVRNTPTVSLRIKGRAFDARPFSDANKKKEPAAAAGTSRTGAGGAAGEAPPPAGIAGILLLNTSFSAAIDSVITEKAIFTAAGCEGSAVRGIMKVRKLVLDYAGGKGTGSGEIDLREYPKIVSSFDIRFSGVQADRALVRMHSLGALLKGTFSFATSGKALTGPGIDPLAMLSAAGDATSTSGVLDLSGFLSPVSSAFNIDVSSLEKVDFRSWTGKYFIKDGRLTTEDWQMVSSSGKWDVAGSFGFDGSLDYRARLVIPPAVQAGMKDLSKFGDLVDLFKDDKGNIVLDFDIGGDARDPKVQLDQTAARARAGEKLIDNLKEGGIDKLKSLFKKKDQ